MIMTNFRCFEMIMKDYNEFNEIIPVFLAISQIESIMYKILTSKHAVCMNEYVTGHTSPDIV